MNTLQVEYVPVNLLKTYANNAKIHTAEQVEQIKNSITEFGFNDPIAVWKDNEIIEGHGRLIAATELGMTEVPIIRLDQLTDEQRRAYTIAHNKLTMNTGFEFSILETELESIKNIDMTEIGFTEAELLEITIDDSDITGKRPIADNYDNAYENVPVFERDESEQYADDEFETELKQYAERANDSQLVTKRVIIVYQTEQEEEFIRDLLKIGENDPTNVVYNVRDLMRNYNDESAE